jgi:hypothetical protein
VISQARCPSGVITEVTGDSSRIRAKTLSGSWKYPSPSGLGSKGVVVSLMPPA